MTAWHVEVFKYYFMGCFIIERISRLRKREDRHMQERIKEVAARIKELRASWRSAWAIWPNIST